MKKIANNGNNRRKFLSLGLLGGAALMTQKAAAMVPIESEEETVPMLTADGKLVQVSKSILEKTSDRQKARNMDVLNWSNALPKTDK